MQRFLPITTQNPFRSADVARNHGPAVATIDGHAQRILNELPDRPVYNHDESAALRIHDLPVAREPRSIAQLIDRIEESVVRPGLLPSPAGHLAYIPGGGLYASSLADYLAAVTNEYAGVSFVGPGSVAMENLVLDWMKQVVGYPATADGNLASGGSIASLIAIVAAREAAGLRARILRARRRIRLAAPAS